MRSIRTTDDRRWTTVVSRLSSAVAAALVTALVIVAAWKLTFGDRIIARGDLLLYFYPLRDYASQAIREFRLPLWNPYTFMGAPFLANSQVGFFYPFNMLAAWLPVERAVSWNIALHLVIAALGAYALAVEGLKIGRLAGLACAASFGLGGYLGAQVEHLNQLQALAWLPLMLLTIADPSAALRTSLRLPIGDQRAVVRTLLTRTLALTALVSLQVLAGHTQSLYICLVTLGIVAITRSTITLVERRRSLSAPLLLRSLAPLLILIASAILAVLLCAVQLLPTVELSSQSARAGGLPFNEAGSFSWRPWVIARALMPTYGDPLFAEYVAYLGAFGLALALLGGLEIGDWRLGRESSISNLQSLVPIALTITGFVLALGVVTPLFNVLYRFMPGFNLFRAQARWLVVFALGASLLIGLGVQRLRDGLTARQARNWLIVWLVLMAILVAGLLAGVRISPEPEYQSLPARNVLIGWAVAAIVATVSIAWVWRQANLNSLISGLFVFGLIAELLLASQFQPYSRAADRQALTSLRPATAQLLADALPSPAWGGVEGGGRVLALSSLFFDPGDKTEQEMIYSSQLSADEVYDRIIASKQKEILSPNLPLYYRLPSVDGYDGGLLPLLRYAEFVKQFTSTSTGTVDGRLREFLKGVPANEWLDKMAVRYVIADKTQDVFIDGVYYDLLFSEPVRGVVTTPLQPYESTALGLVLSAPGAKPNDQLATARVQFDDGSEQTFDIRATEAVTQPYFGLRLEWEGRKTPTQLNLTGLKDMSGLTLRGLTSIDDSDKTFLPQMVTGGHDMRVVHSGDVKIYENLKPAPRVLLSGEAEAHGSGGKARIIFDSPEKIVIETETPTTNNQQLITNYQLILRDACYPGWVARIDGVETPIECVDILFRAVQAPAGKHTVEFSYEPASIRAGTALSLAGIAVCLLLAANVIRMRRNVLSSAESSTTEGER
jgi:hypothetical protein